MGKIVKSVSLSYEIGKQFDNYDNFSQLVEKLLAQHLAINPEILKKEIESKTQVLEKIKETIETENQITQEKAEKIVAAKKEKEEYLKNSFREDLGRDITEEELKDYIALFEGGLTDYYSFIGGLKKKDGQPR